MRGGVVHYAVGRCCWHKACSSTVSDEVGGVMLTRPCLRHCLACLDGSGMSPPLSTLSPFITSVQLGGRMGRPPCAAPQTRGTL